MNRKMNRLKDQRCALICVLLLTISIQIPAAADDPNPKKPVMLDVSAVDGHGQPVTDLRDGDFRVQDAGKPRDLALVSLDDSQRELVTPLGPRQYSNRASRSAPPTVILFDLLNERLTTAASASYEISESLKHLESNAGLYLYILTNHGSVFPVYPLLNPETNTRTPDLPGTQQMAPLLDQAVRKAWGLRPIGDDIRTRVDATYQAIANLAAQISAVPGRKNLVWVTHGVPLIFADLSLTQIDMSRQLRLLGAALVQNHIAAYTVAQSSLGAGASPVSSSTETLEQLAALTGGRSYSSDSIAAAISAASADARGVYTLAYFPSPEDWNGKWHNIRVTSTRKGVHLRAPSGYYANPGQAPPFEPEREMLAGFASRPLDATEIGLRAAVSSTGGNPLKLHFQLHIDASGLLFQGRPDQSTVELLVGLAEYDKATPDDPPGFATRPRQEIPSVPVHLQFTRDQREKALKDGVDLAQDFTPQASTGNVRLIVMDRTSDRHGSLTISLAPAPANH